MKFSIATSPDVRDNARLEALHRYEVLDTPPERAFDHITALAAHVFDAPIALVSLIDEDRQWHKSCMGVEQREVGLDVSFCVHAIENAPELMVVEDATADSRFADNPLVTGEPGIRFYAGEPLVTPNGHALGTLCVIDTELRTPTDEQLEQLKRLASIVVDELELRREVRVRERVEEQLKRQHEVHQKIFDNAPVMITFFDADGAFITTNKQWERKLGWSAEETKAHPNIMAELFPDPEVRQDALHFMGEAPDEWRDFNVQVRDGSMLETSWTNVKLSDGTCIGIGLDITDRKQYERQLVAAKEKAEEMSQLKSAFLANMSHEIRTPLTSIIGFAEVLKEEPLEDGVNEHVQLIHRAGNRLLETLNSVLDLSQLEAGSMSLTPTDFDAAEEVRQTLNGFAVQAERAAITLTSEGTDGPVEVTLDHRAFQRILTNLVSNAIKFTEPGGRVAVGLAASADTVTLTVEDNGVGIGTQFIGDLFTAFAQESTGATRSYEGTGLGLTITRRLTELMGGSIAVESTKGEGTTFTVTVPRAMDGE
jgi:PAS domain S-box-containing protein